MSARLSIMGQVERDPNGGCCHRWRVYCWGCGLTYVTSGNKWCVERRRGCRGCSQKGNQNARKRPAPHALDLDLVDRVLP